MNTYQQRYALKNNSLSILT